MSLQKQIRKNIAKGNDRLLKQYSNQLVPNWNMKNAHDKDLLARMIRNGITVDDLKAERKRGRDDAFAQTAPLVMKVCYASFAILLVEKFGFTSDDCFDLLTDVDQKISMTLDNEELFAEMEEKAKLRLFAEEGVERVMQI